MDKDIERIKSIMEEMRIDYESGNISKDKYEKLNEKYLQKLNDLETRNAIIKDTHRYHQMPLEEKPIPKPKPENKVKFTPEPIRTNSQVKSNKSSNKIIIGLIVAVCAILVATAILSFGILNFSSDNATATNDTNSSNMSIINSTSTDISDSGSSSSGEGSHSSENSYSGGGSSSSEGGSGQTIDGEVEPPGLDA